MLTKELFKTPRISLALRVPPKVYKHVFQHQICSHSLGLRRSKVYEHCHVWGAPEPPFPCQMLSIWSRKGWGWMIITHLILRGRRKGHGFISGLTYFSLNLFLEAEERWQTVWNIVSCRLSRGQSIPFPWRPSDIDFPSRGDMEQDEAWLVSV